MGRRTPFEFKDYYDPAKPPALPEKFIEGLIEAYEYWLVAEYGPSGDAEAVFYAEGKRETYEELLVELLGVPIPVMDAYWGYTRPTTTTTPEEG